LFVCRGRGIIEDRMRAIVKENQLEDCVDLGGFLNPSEVPIYTKASDMVVVLYKTSRPNNYIAGPPNKLFEAMAAGKPILASNMGELQRIVREEECGIVVNPEDIEGMADVIGNLISDRCTYEKLAKKAKVANEYYNWDNVEKELLGVYGEVCEG
jgi:glycosyltransferase involved in cell wall biosynthesis